MPGLSNYSPRVPPVRLGGGLPGGPAAGGPGLPVLQGHSLSSPPGPALRLLLDQRGPLASLKSGPDPGGAPAARWATPAVTVRLSLRRGCAVCHGPPAGGGLPAWQRQMTVMSDRRLGRRRPGLPGPGPGEARRLPHFGSLVQPAAAAGAPARAAPGSRTRRPRPRPRAPTGPDPPAQSEPAARASRASAARPAGGRLWARSTRNGSDPSPDS
jgi:hypothetical protein